jgi:hypothetical protein
MNLRNSSSRHSPQRHVARVREATGGRGTWLWDRGADRDELMLPWLRRDVAFVIRQRGDRHVTGPDGRCQAVTTWAVEWQPARWPRPWPRRGYTACGWVWLPEDPAHELLLVVHWRLPGGEPWLLLVSPKARRPGRTAAWFVKAYRRRWGVEDAKRGVKQQFRLEAFLVRTWRALRRLLVLVGWAFWWLNLWGEERYARLRQALLDHPWRLPKEVTYLFNWIAQMVHDLLHPRPCFRMSTG